MSINLNFFSHINPNKLLRYGFIKRIKQTYRVFHGDMDWFFNRHRAGVFDYATLGLGMLTSYCYVKTKALAETESRLFYLPLAPLVVLDLAFTAVRILFSALLTIPCLLVIVPFHLFSMMCNACESGGGGESDARVDICVADAKSPKLSSTGKAIKKTAGRVLKAVDHGMQKIEKQIDGGQSTASFKWQSPGHGKNKGAATVKLKF